MMQHADVVDVVVCELEVSASHAFREMFPRCDLRAAAKCSTRTGEGQIAFCELAKESCQYGKHVSLSCSGRKSDAERWDANQFAVLEDVD